MKKKKEAKIASEPTVSKIENTAVIDEIQEERKVEVKVDKLNIGFPNEDMNKVVAKLNEVIEKLND